MKFKHVGFTGTRNGCTEKQKDSIRKAFKALKENAEKLNQTVVFHHGGCIGADYDACMLALKFGFQIHVHPPINNRYIFDYEREADFVEPPMEYLDRNRRIVDAVDSMLCCPAEKKEKLRSGTWSTIRYAYSRNRRRMIIYPDGDYTLIKAK